MKIGRWLIRNQKYLSSPQSGTLPQAISKQAAQSGRSPQALIMLPAMCDSCLFICPPSLPGCHAGLPIMPTRIAHRVWLRSEPRIEQLTAVQQLLYERGCQVACNSITPIIQAPCRLSQVGTRLPLCLVSRGCRAKGRVKGPRQKRRGPSLHPASQRYLWLQDPSPE